MNTQELEQEERRRFAEHAANLLIKQAADATREMALRRKVGLRYGLPNIEQLTKPRKVSLEPPYQEWEVSLLPREVIKGIALGWFTLGKYNEGITRLGEDAKPKDQIGVIVEIFQEAERPDKFFGAVISTIKSLRDEYDSAFEEEVKKLSEREQRAFWLSMEDARKLNRAQEVAETGAEKLRRTKSAFWSSAVKEVREDLEALVKELAS